MTYNVFSGTLNPTHFTSPHPSDPNLNTLATSLDLGMSQADLHAG